jgi:energy-coupling factor transporter ATP-binding protein EcfA2
MSNDEIHIGNHAFAKNEQRVYLKDAARGQHCHIIGSTGTGKSKLMEHMIRQDIRNGKGICLIDPHGTLFDATLKWVVANGYEHRLVVLDPTQTEWSVGLNFFEYNPAVFDLGQHVEDVMIGIGKARNEDIFATSHVVIWLRNFLQLAARHSLSPLEVCELLDNKARRNELTAAFTDDPVVRLQLEQAWRLYDTAQPNMRREMMQLPVYNRMQTFLSTRTMRRIVGQSKTTVDFHEAMQKNKIVLVNLHGQLTENEQRLLGIIVIDKLFQAAMRRAPDRGDPFYVYIDEFGNFVSERIAHALEELRKRRVSFILAHQELEQLRDDTIIGGKRLLAAVMSNTKVKIAFRTSREDAEAMAMEMFAGFITGDEIKHEQKVMAFWPEKTRERVYASGSSTSESDIDSIMESIGSVSTASAGQVFVPEVGFMGADQLTAISSGAGTTSSDSSGQSRGSARGYSTSEVEIDVPFYDLIPHEQIVSTTFYSVDEIKERYIQFLQNQAERFFHLRVTGETTKPPIALQTPQVDSVDLLPSVLRAAMEKAVKRTAVPSAEIDQLYEHRMQALLNPPKPQADDANFTYNADDVERISKTPIPVQKGRRKSR